MAKAQQSEQPVETSAAKPLPWPRRPEPLDKDLCGPPMPVAKMVFRQGFEAPGLTTSTLQDQGVKLQGGGQHRTTLEFYPRIRHYRVTKHHATHDYSILVYEGHVTYSECVGA